MIDVMVITHNEALNLPHCLRSMQGWTNKMFVIDSGSDDGTQDIARQLGAEVIHHDWEGYAGQKNWGLDNLLFESPWTLLIDADEVITNDLRSRLMEIASKPIDEVEENGFFINRLTYFLGKPIRHCSYFPSWNLRFFKRGLGRYEDREVHEHVIINDPVGYVPEPMIHDDRRGLEHYVAKHNRYSTLEARAVFAEMNALSSGQATDFASYTKKRRWLKRKVTSSMPLPGLWRFVYMYVLRMGFLDGMVGWHFCRFIAAYETLVALKLRELRRQAKVGGELEARPQSIAGLAEAEGTLRVWGDDLVTDTEALQSDGVGGDGSYGSGGGAGAAVLVQPVPADQHSEAAVDANLDTSAQGYLTQRLGDHITPGSRVIVTGGSGFIGTNLVHLYHNGGAEVINIDRAAPRLPAHQEFWREIDILEPEPLEKCIRDFEPDLVFHLAARTDLDEKAGMIGYDANVAGVGNMLKAMEGLDSLKRIVMTSTQLVCRPGYRPKSDTDYAPHTVYGRSKIETERVTRAWKNPPCPWTLVRPTSIWGPWFDMPYRDFFMTIAKQQYRHPRGRNPLRSFGFVGNAVYEYIAMVEAPEEKVDRRTFYLADLEPVRVRDWANTITAELGLRPLAEVSINTLRLAAKVGDITHAIGLQFPPITSFRLRNLLTDNYCDMSPVREAIGEMPYTIREGVRITARWMRERKLI